MWRRGLGAIRYSSFLFSFRFVSIFVYETLANVLQSILDCSEANEGFYVKCGFKRAGLEMAHYY